MIYFNQDNKLNMKGFSILMDKVLEDSITIRKAVLSDLDPILKVIDKAAIWMYESDIRIQWIPGNVYKDRDHYISCINKGLFYVVLTKNRLIGTFLLKWSDEELWGEQEFSAGYLHHFAIDRSFSGNGLGDYLLNQIENIIRDNGKSYIRLDCIAANLKLNEYYLDRAYSFVQQYIYYDGKLGNLYEKSIY